MNKLNNVRYHGRRVQSQQSASNTSPNAAAHHSSISPDASLLFQDDICVSTAQPPISLVKTVVIESINELLDVFKNVNTPLINNTTNGTIKKKLRTMVSDIKDEGIAEQISRTFQLLADLFAGMCELVGQYGFIFDDRLIRCYNAVIITITRLTTSKLVVLEIINAQSIGCADHAHVAPADALLKMLAVLTKQFHVMMQSYNKAIKQHDTQHNTKYKNERKQHNRKPSSSAKPYNSTLMQCVSINFHTAPVIISVLAGIEAVCNDIATHMNDVDLKELFNILYTTLIMLDKHRDRKNIYKPKTVRDTLIAISRLVIIQKIPERWLAIYGRKSITELCNALKIFLEPQKDEPSKLWLLMKRDAVMIIIALTRVLEHTQGSTPFASLELVGVYHPRSNHGSFSVDRNIARVMQNIAQCGDILKHIESMSNDFGVALFSVLIDLLPCNKINISCKDPKKDPKIIISIIVSITYLVSHESRLFQILSMKNQMCQVLLNGLVNLVYQYSNNTHKLESLIVSHTLTVIGALTERAQLLAIRQTSCMDFQYLLCMLCKSLVQYSDITTEGRASICKSLVQYSNITTEGRVSMINKLLMIIVNLTDHIDSTIEQQITSMALDDFSQLITSLSSELGKLCTTCDEAESAITTNLVIIIANLVANTNICKKITSMDKTYFPNLVIHLKSALALYKSIQTEGVASMINNLLITIDALIDPQGNAIAKQMTPNEQ